MDGWVALLDSLDAFDAPRRAPMPLPMEALDQVTLYAPAPLWRAGTNEVVMLELEHPTTDAICGRNPAWVAPLPDLQPCGNPTNG